MNKVTLSLALAFTPALLAAQSSGQAQARGQTSADVRTNQAQASAATSVDAEVAMARERGLPTRPIQRRAAEARAKGATRAQAAVAARTLRADFETAHAAMVKAGRPAPKEEEVERGGYAIERGYTSTEIEAVAKSAPADRSLVVAFDVLTRLAARGVSSATALAQVQSKLEARASDAQIDELVSANANLGAGASGAVGGAGAAVTGNAAAGAKVGGAAAGVAGSVGGAVGGVIKKP